MFVHRNLFIKCLILSCSLVASVWVNAATSLYEVTKGDHTLYLGGTIHLLRSNE